MVELRNEFVHVAANGNRFVVIHGDQFDKVELCAQWLSRVGSVAYDLLLWANAICNRARRRLGLPDRRYSGAIKKRFKQAVRFISRFEDALAKHARARSCQGIVCGHIHTPTISNLNGVLYCNSGDWVENLTALIEDRDGGFRIFRWDSQLQTTTGTSQERAVATGSTATTLN